jgi:hypothetical protein
MTNPQPVSARISILSRNSETVNWRTRHPRGHRGDVYRNLRTTSTSNLHIAFSEAALQWN